MALRNALNTLHDAVLAAYEEDLSADTDGTDETAWNEWVLKIDDFRPYYHCFSTLYAHSIPDEVERQASSKSESSVQGTGEARIASINQAMAGSPTAHQELDAPRFCATQSLVRETVASALDEVARLQLRDERRGKVQRARRAAGIAHGLFRCLTRVLFSYEALSSNWLSCARLLYCIGPVGEREVLYQGCELEGFIVAVGLVRLCARSERGRRQPMQTSADSFPERETVANKAPSSYLIDSNPLEFARGLAGSIRSRLDIEVAERLYGIAKQTVEGTGSARCFAEIALFAGKSATGCRSHADALMIHAMSGRAGLPGQLASYLAFGQLEPAIRWLDKAFLYCNEQPDRLCLLPVALGLVLFNQTVLSAFSHVLALKGSALGTLYATIPDVCLVDSALLAFGSEAVNEAVIQELISSDGMLASFPLQPITTAAQRGIEISGKLISSEASFEGFASLVAALRCQLYLLLALLSYFSVGKVPDIPDNLLQPARKLQDSSSALLLSFLSCVGDNMNLDEVENLLALLVHVDPNVPTYPWFTTGVSAFCAKILGDNVEARGRPVRSSSFGSRVLQAWRTFKLRNAHNMVVLPPGLPQLLYPWAAPAAAACPSLATRFPHLCRFQILWEAAGLLHSKHPACKCLLGDMMSFAESVTTFLESAAGLTKPHANCEYDPVVLQLGLTGFFLVLKSMGLERKANYWTFTKLAQEATLHESGIWLLFLHAQRLFSLEHSTTLAQKDDQVARDRSVPLVIRCFADDHEHLMDNPEPILRPDRISWYKRLEETWCPGSTTGALLVDQCSGPLPAPSNAIEATIRELVGKVQVVLTRFPEFSGDPKLLTNPVFAEFFEALVDLVQSSDFPLGQPFLSTLNSGVTSVDLAAEHSLWCPVEQHTLPSSSPRIPVNAFNEAYYRPNMSKEELGRFLPTPLIVKPAEATALRVLVTQQLASMPDTQLLTPAISPASLGVARISTPASSISQEHLPGFTLKTASLSPNRTPSDDVTKASRGAPLAALQSTPASISLCSDFIAVPDQGTGDLLEETALMPLPHAVQYTSALLRDIPQDYDAIFGSLPPVPSEMPKASDNWIDNTESVFAKPPFVGRSPEPRFFHEKNPIKLWHAVSQIHMKQLALQIQQVDEEACKVSKEMEEGERRALTLLADEKWQQAASHLKSLRSRVDSLLAQTTADTLFVTLEAPFSAI